MVDIAITGCKNYWFFLPILSDTRLQVVENFRLLGIIFQTNLSWQSNTDNMCKNGYSRIWMLRRLKKLGASCTDMLDVYFKQIRCVLELAVAVWTPGLTKAESTQIERVQKCALHVILGGNYGNYDHSTQALEVEKLSERRLKLSLNFARRCEKNPKYSNWFHPFEAPPPPTVNTRNDNHVIIPTKYTPVPFRTERYEDSPLPFLTDLLNKYYLEKK